MAFSGTLDKCNACNKTVYVVDLLSADGISYHKSCFKCTHCKGTLVMSNYSSLDGVLYCKTHFEQLFKGTGSFTKSSQTGRSEKQNELAKAPNKLSSLFSGTLDKCATCNKTAYPLEKVTVEGESYHKSCFKCSHGGCSLTTSSYAALDGILYCKHHFSQLFMMKGSYNHLIQTATMKKTAAAVSDEEQQTNATEAEATPNAELDAEVEPEENTQEQS